MFQKYRTIFLFLFTSMIQTSNSLQKHIYSIIQEFHLYNPHLIGSIGGVKMELIKALMSKDDHFLNIYPKIGQFSFKEEVTANAIVFLNSEIKVPDEENNLEWPKNSHHNLMLISRDDIFEELLTLVAAQCAIHQQVFILNAASQEIFEAYTINNVIIKKKLGQIDKTSSNFKWKHNVNPNFVKRRSDFHGISLKGMVEFGGMNMNADLSYLEKAKYFADNETYLITDFAHGLFHDVLLILQDSLNFSTVLFKRKESNWGYVNLLENGSYEGTGIVGDVFFKRADIGAAPAFITIDRANFIDFLPPMQPFLTGIFIPTISNIAENGIEFKTYTSPFTNNLWIAVTITGGIFAAIKILLFKFHDDNGINSVLVFDFDHFWTSYSGFLGGQPNSTPIDAKSSYRTTIIVSLLCGTVIWIAYCARLSAELSIVEKKYPFQDMDSFSKTNWRYNIPHFPILL